MADPQPPQQQINISNANMPIPYSDFAMLRSNPDGLVIDFMQAMGPGGQFQVVSRAGMSLDQGKKLLAALQQHLGGKAPAQQQPQQTSTGTQQIGFSIDNEKA